MQAPLELADMGLIATFVAAGILLRGRVNPMIPITRASVVGALIGGFGLGEIPDFLSEGLGSVIKSTRGKSGNAGVITKKARSKAAGESFAKLPSHLQ